MRITLADRIRALFSRDEESFWFSEYADDERQLGRMTALELAQAIDEASVRNDVVKKIVAEHMLNLRLAKLQANASWGSSFVGIGGVIVGALLSSWLSSAPFQESQNVAECKTEITKQGSNEAEKQKPINGTDKKHSESVTNAP